MGDMNKIRRENFVAGLVGAFLGTVLGTVCIVIIGQLGYVAAVSGLIMAVCALKGYEKFAGGLSKKGIIASGVLILLMTYFGNRMDWAFSASRVLDMGLLEAYRSIPMFIDEGVIESVDYWLNLVLLYLFTLAGAVPTIYHAIRSAQEDPEAAEQRRERMSEEDPSALTVYAPEYAWIKPCDVMNVLACLAPLLVFVMFMFAPDTFFAHNWLVLASMFLPLLLMLVVLIRNNPFVRTKRKLYAKQGGILWQVDLYALNLHLESSGRQSHTAARWDKFSVEKQTRYKQAILYAIRTRQTGGKSDPITRCVTSLHGLEVIKNGKRVWKVQYEDDDGRRKNLSIVKVYPDLILESGMEPVEKAPRMAAVPAILLAVSCMLPLLSIVLPETASLSENRTDCDLGSIHFSVEKRFEEDEQGIYIDPKSETLYYIDPTLYGMGPEDVRPMLEMLLSDLESSFEGHTSNFAAPEGELLELEGPNGQTYMYDRYLFEAEDGTVALGYAAYLPENQCVVRIDAVLDNEPAEDVEIRILSILQTLEVDPDAEILNIKEELTEENYQSFFAPAVDLGYTYMGRSYIKIPEGMYDGQFADVFLPYSEDPLYSDDGTMMSSRAHGVQVDVTLIHHAGAAKDVAKELGQQVFAAKGKELTGDVAADDELNVAVWVTTQEADGYEAPILFYADEKVPGYYLAAIISYYPAEMDESSDAMIAELSDVYAMNLPLMSDVAGENPAA